MKRLLLSTFLTLALAGAAFAKTPPEVLKPYQEYRAAIEAGDTKLATKRALEAWQAAEKLVPDSKLTGDLAQNYGDMVKSDPKNQIKAYKRAQALTADYGDIANEVFLERSVKLGNAYLRDDSQVKAFNTAQKASKFAEGLGLTQSTFYAEALTLQAGYHARKGRNDKAEEIADKALEAFSLRNDGIQSAYPILANMYSGYGKEANGKTVEAALHYQTVMEALDGINPKEHKIAALALGRWSHMRSRLRTEGKLQEAEEKGLCKCWPYDQERNETLKPVKRIPGKMPSKAYVSGFAIVEFDLDDKGNVINPEVLVSWPEELYEKPSLRALKAWKYTARSEAETDADRQNIISTFRYRLTDRTGDVIY